MPFLRTLLTHGLLLGLALGLYTTIMWLTRLDTTYLSIGQYLDILVLLVPAGFIVAAVRRQRQLGYVSFPRRLALAVGVMVVGEVLYRPCLYLYHEVINPTWFDAVLALKRTELTASGSSSATIAANLARMQASQAAQAGMFHDFWVSALLLPTVISLLTWPFLRNRAAPKVRLAGPVQLM